MKKFQYLLLVTLLTSFASLPQASAKISLQADFTGTLVITFPDGEIALLETGDNIPDIPNESTIEVFDGSFTVTTEEGDAVKISCLDTEARLEGAKSVVLTCGEDQGSVKSARGAITLTDSEGKTISLAEGAEQAITLGAPLAATDTAPPAGAGEGPAFPGADDTPPVDSRGIDASPAQ